MCVLLLKTYGNISTYKREAFLKHHVGEVALYSRNIPLVRNSLLLYNKSFIGGGGGGGGSSVKRKFCWPVFMKIYFLRSATHDFFYWRSKNENILWQIFVVIL